ncbi:unnamed protein product [Closterium sp. Yama58-4]|nr:unnamed protein product [Closterium sp. Yama58-4]
MKLLGISHDMKNNFKELNSANADTDRLLASVPTVVRATEWIVRRLPPELFSTSLIQDYPGHNSTVQQALEGVVVWDSVFFHRIALCGYEFEQAYAFFPLLPLLMRLLATATPCECFLLSSLALVNVTTRSPISPSRPPQFIHYSESLFALLSFAAMSCVVSGRWVSASLLIALSAAARSNGVLHAGFFLFSLLQAAGPLILLLLPRRLLQRLFSAVRPQGDDDRHTSHRSTGRETDRRVSAAGVAGRIALLRERKWLLCLTRHFPILLSTALCCLLAFSLLLSFQFFAFTQFCRPASTATPHDVPPWCFDSVPYIYGYVQRKYWDVGFLRYFQLKQLPNFLLAAPTLLLSLSAILSFALARPLLFLSLGLLSSPADQPHLLFLPPPNHPQAREREEGVEEEKGEEGEVEWRRYDRFSGCKGFYSAAALPFLLQLLFMTAVATLVMHVQVATRFLSSSPPLYWFLAHLLTSSIPNQSPPKEKSWRLFIIRAWIGASLGYAVIGSLLFINFYPFT